jgi:hypothetical protein
MILSSKWTILFEYTITHQKIIIINQLEALETLKEYE